MEWDNNVRIQCMCICFKKELWFMGVALYHSIGTEKGLKHIFNMLAIGFNTKIGTHSQYSLVVSTQTVVTI